MSPVKRRPVPLGQRLDRLLETLSPFQSSALTYKQLAELMGAGYTEDQVKSWQKRSRIPEPARDRLIHLAGELGLSGVTMAWLRDGVGEGPAKRDAMPPGRPVGARVSEAEGDYGGGAPGDYAALAGSAVARTLREALDRGWPLKQMGFYLLDVSIRGPQFGLDEIRELVDLGRRCLWEDEHPTGSKEPRPARSSGPSGATSSTGPGTAGGRS